MRLHDLTRTPCSVQYGGGGEINLIWLAAVLGIFKHVVFSKQTKVQSVKFLVTVTLSLEFYLLKERKHERKKFKYLSFIPT